MNRIESNWIEADTVEPSLSEPKPSKLISLTMKTIDPVGQPLASPSGAGDGSHFHFCQLNSLEILCCIDLSISWHWHGRCTAKAAFSHPRYRFRQLVIVWFAIKTMWCQSAFSFRPRHIEWIDELNLQQKVWARELRISFSNLKENQRWKQRHSHHHSHFFSQKILFYNYVLIDPIYLGLLISALILALLILTLLEGSFENLWPYTN